MELEVGKKYKVKIPELTSSHTESGLYVNYKMLDMEGTILTIIRVARGNTKWYHTVESQWTWDIHTLVPIHDKKLIGGNIL